MTTLTDQVATSPAEATPDLRRLARHIIRPLIIGAIGGALFDLTVVLHRTVPPVAAGPAAVAVLLALSAGFAIGWLQASRRTVEAPSVSIDLASTAHDLRSPILMMRSYLEMLSTDAALPAHARTAAGRASHAAQRAQALVDNLLIRHAETAATAAGAARTAPRAAAATRPMTAAAPAIPDIDAIDLPPLPGADLHAVVTDVRAWLAHELAAAEAHIEVTGLPRSLPGDTEELHRVFANLVQNALVHRRPGAPARISISAEHRGANWRIAVHDNGRGIPASLRNHVFEPGVRGPAPDAGPGFGLGLATVQRIVTDHGGRVWVDPGTTAGTCIYIELPA